ncbi:hypothetical protein GDO78_011465 [Eleutherodactylus coqui]|uniref:Uncharacterized protein n=1 Tax=Eleutherodactylus coqui TaxID=57060 RepID=A0A8J6K6P3_ELECQ|nr:hypothetical protein GDO78_011465 [Eleutherodactylus coqui]
MRLQGQLQPLPEMVHLPHEGLQCRNGALANKDQPPMSCSTCPKACRADVEGTRRSPEMKQFSSAGSPRVTWETLAHQGLL